MTSGSMQANRLLRVLSIALLIAYPFIVYFGLNNFEPRQMVLVLALLALCRVLGSQTRDGMLIYWLAALVVAAVTTLILNSSAGLLFYPVLVSLAFLLFFSISLIRPPTVIEAIATRQEGPLTPAGISYTRKVTIVWCGFFIINACVASYTAFASREVWVFYNGFLSYLLMALLFSGEYLVRRRVRKHAS